MTATATQSRATLRDERRARLGSPAPALVVAAIAFAAAGLIGTEATGSIRTVVVTAALLVAPGFPVVRLLPIRDPFARGGLVVATSLAIEGAVALPMVWTGHWSVMPVAGLLLLTSGVFVLGDGIQVARTVWRGVEAPGRREAAPLAVRIRGIVYTGALVAAAMAWALGIVSTDTTSLGEWGLLTAVPAVWYVGAGGILAIAVTTLVDRRTVVPVRALAVGLLVVVSFGSTNLIEQAPRPPWVFKHIAVTEYVTAHGSVNAAIDIYNRWPGFFTTSAFVGEATGHPNVLDYVRYTEPAFALVNAALVIGIARTMGLGSRWAFVSAVVFSAGNWVGQSYYSPQAFAYVLYLSAVLVALTLLRRRPIVVGRWLERLTGRVFLAKVRPPVDVRPAKASRTATIVAVLVLLLLQGVITASHQLTPFVLIATLVPLFVLGYIRPWWLALPLTAMPLLYLIPNYTYIAGKYGLTTGSDPIANFTASADSVAIPSLATTLESRGLIVLTGLIGVLALLGMIRRVRAGHSRNALVLLWLAVAPAAVCLAQSYGGEAKFRVVLFAMPFLAIGVGWLFRGRLGRVIPMAIALVVVVAISVGATFQVERTSRTPPEDVHAATWLDHRFTEEDAMVSIGSFPAVIGANYENYLHRWNQIATLEDYASYWPKGATIAQLEKALRTSDAATKTGTTYIVFSDADRADAISSGALTATQIDRLEKLMKTIGALKYSHDGVRIYGVVYAR